MRIADIFLHCNDIDEMRAFYSEKIGLDETFYSDKYKHLTYKLSTEPEITLVIMEHPKKGVEYNEKWDMGPVFRAGDGTSLSWSIRVETIDEYREKIKGLDDVDTFSETPQWMGYWSYMIKDPSGTTIDFYCEIEHEGEETPEWT